MIKFEFVGLEVSNEECTKIELILNKELRDFSDAETIIYECRVDILKSEFRSFDLLVTLSGDDCSFSPKLILIYGDTIALNVMLGDIKTYEKYFRHHLLEKGLI